jgi:hypothetical protein
MPTRDSALAVQDALAAVICRTLSVFTPSRRATIQENCAESDDFVRRGAVLPELQRTER